MRRTAEFLVRQKGFNRFAFLYEDRNVDGIPDAYGRGLRDDFLNALEILGIRREEVLAVGYVRNQKNFKKELRQVAQGDYQALGLLGLLNDSVNIAKTARDMGISAVFFGGTGIAAREFAEKGGKFVEGSIVFSPFFARDSDWNVYQFTEKYYKEFGNYPDTYAAQSYDAMKMLIQALDKIDLAGLKHRTRDIRKEIRNELERIKHDGVSGYMEFDRYHDTDRRLKILIAHKGRLVPIRTVENEISLFFFDLRSMWFILSLVTAAILLSWAMTYRSSPRFFNIVSLLIIIGIMAFIYWKVPHFPELLALVLVMAFLALLGIVNRKSILALIGLKARNGG